MNRWVNHDMIIVILFTALILRLILLNQSLWLDEATTALVAKMSLSDLFTKFLPGDFHPPLYYLIINQWTKLFGYSEVSLRFPSILFGVASVFIVYLIGKEFFDKKVGLIASLLLATSGLHIYYSQEARMYSLATFLVSLTVYFFLKQKWFWFSILMLLIGLTDYVSLFIAPVFLIVGYKQWKKVILSYLPLIIGFLVWSPIFIKQLVAGVSVQGTNWWNILGTATFKNFVLIPVKFVLGRISFDNKLIYALIIGVMLAIFSYLLFKARGVNKTFWAWLILPIVIGVLVSIKIPTLSYFRFLFCLPALYILLASGIEKLGKYKNIALYILVVPNMLFTTYYVLTPRFHREDWRRAANSLGANKIVFPANSQKEALIYYGKGDQIVSTDQLGKGDREIWLSRYVSEIFDPDDATRMKIENLGYNKVSEANFNGVVFWKYFKTQ